MENGSMKNRVCGTGEWEWEQTIASEDEGSSGGSDEVIDTTPETSVTVK